MRVLIIEDEKKLAEILKKGLEEHSFTVDLSFDGEDGLYMAETYTFDAVILDVMLPVMDGFTILEKLRERNIEMPVLMLTARGEVKDRIRGLNRGADDYIAKPFDFSELLARLKAVIRRHKGKASPLIEVGDLMIDINSHSVRRGGVDMRLSAREYVVLEYLALNRGKVVSRSELIEHVYDTDFDLDSNVIDVYINYLRNKIDKGFERHLVHTMRGVGYIIKERE